MDYCAVIRTLGKAGDKYNQLLGSLSTQTNKPKKVLVYIAEGYELPCVSGNEQYIYVKKGMVAQRALPFDEVDSDYILFLDDDVYLPPTAVEHLFQQMQEHGGDVISPDVFLNSDRPFKSRVLMTISARMMARRNDKKWGYKVMRNGGYSYNLHPFGTLLSQSNAGPCFLCKKTDFLSINFAEELWMDAMPYALGDDQVMFYKMYKRGLKVLTSYDSGIVHLDARSATASYEKERVLAYCDTFFKTVFWHRFIYLPEKNLILKLYDCICYAYTRCFNLSASILRRDTPIYQSKLKGYKEAWSFIKSDEYSKLERI